MVGQSRISERIRSAVSTARLIHSCDRAQLRWVDCGRPHPGRVTAVHLCCLTHSYRIVSQRSHIVHGDGSDETAHQNTARRPTARLRRPFAVRLLAAPTEGGGATPGARRRRTGTAALGRPVRAGNSWLTPGGARPADRAAAPT
jgi:hypothetical protein